MNARGSARDQEKLALLTLLLAPSHSTEPLTVLRDVPHPYTVTKLLTSALFSSQLPLDPLTLADGGNHVHWHCYLHSG